MKNKKKLGIWMDHSHALLMEIKDDVIIEEKIESEFTREEKEWSLTKNENLMHHKEQQMQSSFYKKLGDIIKNYQEVMLFGSTEAKSELLNKLKADHLFEEIKIELKHVDKMTENQRHSFVKEYFK